jgi:sialate O-acetylesterase
MIAPLLTYPKAFPIKGTIWYQGESNVKRAHQYRKLFPALIADWRRGWAQGDFPFLYVQLPNYIAEKKAKPDHLAEPEESAWAELREAQAKSLAVPKTAMVVTIDIGDPRDIHPKNKQDVGHRLALSALKLAYGQDVPSSGPEFKSMKVIDGEAHLEFQHAEDGLVIHGDQLKGFAIAGADKKFVWATGRIDGAKVIVSSPDVKEPVAVRYAWADNPDCNLFNKSGLPAGPFRTDDWAGVTIQNK